MDIERVAVKVDTPLHAVYIVDFFTDNGASIGSYKFTNSDHISHGYIGVDDGVVKWVNGSELSNYEIITIPLEVIEMTEKKEGEYRRYCVSLVYAKQQNGNATLELRSAITESRSEFEALGEVVTNFTNKMPGFGLILHNAIEIENDKSGDN